MKCNNFTLSLNAVRNFWLRHYTENILLIWAGREMFFGDTNRWAIIFFQENILKYEWNDNVPHKSLSTWRCQSKKITKNIFLHQRTKNTHNVSGKNSSQNKDTLKNFGLMNLWMRMVCFNSNFIFLKLWLMHSVHASKVFALFDC